jgi:hypothetical protein
VCVSITFRSSGVSGPALLMISFGIRTLPTSWSSAANSASLRSREETQAVHDRERQLDDVAARVELLLSNVTSLIGTKAVAFRFTAEGRGAAYQLDDVYLDPWKCF